MLEIRIPEKAQKQSGGTIVAGSGVFKTGAGSHLYGNPLTQWGADCKAEPSPVDNGRWPYESTLGADAGAAAATGSRAPLQKMTAGTARAVNEISDTHMPGSTLMTPTSTK